MCALSLAPASYLGNEEFSADWTFADDGKTMTDLWGLQLLTLFFICAIGVYPLRVPTPKRLYI